MTAVRLSAGCGCSRREILAMLSACGVSLTLPALDARAASRRRTERPRSLLTLWMGGGMSQLETWDPHPGTASGGEVRSIPTSVPGVEISELLPRTAEQLHHALLIRSLTSREGDHERGTSFVKTGYRPEPTLNYPSLGAIVTHELPNPAIEIPQHIALAADASFSHGGYLGNEWDAFRVFDPGSGLTNLQADVSQKRQAERLEGLAVVSRQFRAARRFATAETLHEETLDRALRMMSSEQLRAFDLESEPAAIRQAYGDTRFGRGCLIARRLLEVGVRAIEVSLSGFDTHVANHEGHITQCAVLDPALATLLRELSERDLLQSTIVLCLSEFGRTPQINPAGGRDHWPNWFSGLVAGGGFRRGAVIGATPPEQPEAKTAMPTEPVTIPQLYATVLHALGIDGAREIMTPIGRPIRFADAEPAEWLLERQPV